MRSGNANKGSDVTPVFGLTKSDLKPIVEEAVCESVVSFDVRMEDKRPDPYGFSSEKAIPTFDYVTEAGRAGSIPMFVKRFHRTGPSEAQQYRFLREHQAPMPRMYGARSDSEGREILFVERVETCSPIGTMREALSLMARFHAIQPSAEFRVWLDQSPCRVFVRLAQAGCAIERVYGHARDGELGRPLQEFCSSSVRSLRQLQSAARQVAERTEAMPRGLVHTDFSRENMGRHRPGELLVLDVEFVSIGPRFFDVAGMIGWPPQKWSPDLRNIELGRHYLDEYSRGGGTPPSLEVFFDEARLLWLAERLRYVGFILDMALRCSQESPAEDERRRASCDELYRTLTTLLAQYRLRGTNWSVLDRQ